MLYTVDHNYASIVEKCDELEIEQCKELSNSYIEPLYDRPKLPEDSHSSNDYVEIQQCEAYAPVPPPRSCGLSTK